MPPHTRYAPVPQHEEVIILDSITNPHYNFNTGIPNSVPSSQAPSIAGPTAPSIHSIPNSPPPSFHSHSTPGTPRVTPSTTAAELWGVAPSSISLGESSATEICAASDALNTIRLLQTRVDRLEESLGRLLLEKETWGQQTGTPDERNNCCVTFTEASPDLERSIAARGHNCCVSFRGKRDPGSDERRKQVNLIIILLIIAAMVVSIVALRNGGKVEVNESQ